MLRVMSFTLIDLESERQTIEPPKAMSFRKKTKDIYMSNALSAMVNPDAYKYLTVAYDASSEVFTMIFSNTSHGLTSFTYDVTSQKDGKVIKCPYVMQYMATCAKPYFDKTTFRVFPQLPVDKNGNVQYDADGGLTLVISLYNDLDE